ncbi:hypothetical protein ACFX15_019909 [Malus domestica]
MGDCGGGGRARRGGGEGERRNEKREGMIRGKRVSCPSWATLSSLLCLLDLQPWLLINAFGYYRKFKEGLGVQRMKV